MAEEVVGEVNSCLQETATVALQVDDEVFHATCHEEIDSIAEFLVGGGTEAADADVARCGVNHVVGIEGIDRYLVACDGELLHTVHSPTDDAQLHFGAFRATQAFHDFLLRHLHASDGGVVDRHNHVAGDDAHLFGRTAADGLNDDEGVFVHVELHTDALERPRDGLVECLHILGGGVGGMGVKFGEHATDGVFGEFGNIDRVHIELHDGALCVNQFAKLYVEFGRVPLWLLCHEWHCHDEEACQQDGFYVAQFCVHVYGRKSFTS